MLDSASAKILVVVILAIVALFILRILSKQNWRLKKPTWQETQTQPIAATNVPINLVPDIDAGF